MPIDINQVVLFQSLANGILPLHLSPGKSINLAKVVRYEPILLEPDDEVEVETPKGKAAKPKEEYSPGIYLDGQYEPMILTAEENEIFRQHWNNYASLAKFMTAAVHELAATVEQGITDAAAAGTEVH